MRDPAATSAAYDDFIRSLGADLRAGDEPPADRRAWEGRRARLREAMFAAMGPFPDKPCDFDVQHFGELKREGYRIEKLAFQTRPDVWATATVYVPDPVKGKLPAVLCVHGHFAGARRDPVIQARCLGLVKLGFFVLTLDAFGAGERHPSGKPGGYHGALLGSTLWQAGQTLLGMQVYDNRRAVDYLLTRPEVDGDRLGVTGASGGGNQTMYAGALDERFQAVVPVCSVGRYQAYLRAACCVCEVLPGALRFTEEGDVLGLVAPRALMVINASKDSYQFSVGEAEKSLERAKAIFKLYDIGDKLRHTVVEGGHGYSQEMREAMYGWMTGWLKGEGDGKPIPEPKHEVETLDDLACYGDGKRPAALLYPPTFAAREAKPLLAAVEAKTHGHKEAWESAALMLRAELRDRVLGGFPKPPKPDATTGDAEDAAGVRTLPLTFAPEPGLGLAALHRFKPGVKGRIPACVLLHPDGKAEALKHPLAAALVEKDWAVLAPDLRATGAARPENDAVHDAKDHNSAEHGVWVGRPLLGQWSFDVQCLLDWLAAQPGLRGDRLAVAGVGSAGVVALCVAALDERVASAAALDAPVTLVTEEAYGGEVRMGLLAPGLFHVGDVQHLAALAVPRRVIIAGGVSPQGKPLAAKDIDAAYAFTRSVYGLYKQEERFQRWEGEAAGLAAKLGE
jgi:cephalosporin-C deacetylase-like acetyl esterase